MHERQRAITSLFRRKMRPSSARVQRCTFSLTASRLRRVALPDQGVPEAAQKGQRVREEISYICRKGRRAFTISSSSCLPKPAGLSESEGVICPSASGNTDTSEREMKSNRNWTCTKELSLLPLQFSATIVRILLEARTWAVIETLHGFALLSYTTET